jgi:hypothetical protein
MHGSYEDVAGKILDNQFAMLTIFTTLADLLKPKGDITPPNLPLS